jgi:hypothetical protein
MASDHLAGHRPGITVRRALGAIAWLAICFAAVSLSRWWKAPDQNPPLLFAVLGAIVLSPFVAIGTLFGRPLRGLLVGLVLVGGYVIAVSVAVHRGWIGWP